MNNKCHSEALVQQFASSKDPALSRFFVTVLVVRVGGEDVWVHPPDETAMSNLTIHVFAMFVCAGIHKYALSVLSSSAYQSSRPPSLVVSFRSSSSYLIIYLFLSLSFFLSSRRAVALPPSFVLNISFGVAFDFAFDLGKTSANGNSCRHGQPITLRS
jgi:hypothetical protein